MRRIDKAVKKWLASSDDIRNYLFHQTLIEKSDLALCYCCGMLLPITSFGIGVGLLRGRSYCRDCLRVIGAACHHNEKKKKAGRQMLRFLRMEFSRTLRESCAKLAGEHFSEDQIGAMISAARTLSRDKLLASAQDQLADSEYYAKRFDIDLD